MPRANAATPSRKRQIAEKQPEVDFRFDFGEIRPRTAHVVRAAIAYDVTQVSLPADEGMKAVSIGVAAMTVPIRYRAVYELRGSGPSLLSFHSSYAGHASA
jgi:hypothetical protein